MTPHPHAAKLPAALDRLHALRHDNDRAAAYMAANADRFETMRNRHTNGTAPRAISAFQLFQTPPALAERMAEIAGIQPGHTVLEPSAGLGRLLVPIMDRMPSHVTACELSADCCRELFQRFPDVSLLQRDFLTVPQGATFDRIVMNPPFHMRSDIAHTRHALGFLKSGGTLVGLCMDTRHRKSALRHLADHWEKIPAGTFRSEGTNVPTVLFRITA